MRRIVASVIASAVGVGLAGPASQVSAESPKPGASLAQRALVTGDGTVNVNVDTQGRPTITADLLGANHLFGRNNSTDFADGGGQAWTSPTSTTFYNAVVNAGVRSARFPGGTVANTYHWYRTDTQAGGDENGPIPDTFDLGAFTNLVNTGVEPASIVVNFASGSPDEAADFVNQVMSSPLASHAPIYFEVGNEFGTGKQAYWMKYLNNSSGTGTFTAAQLANAYVNGKQVDISAPAVRPDDYRTGSNKPDPLTSPNPATTFAVPYGPIVAGTLVVKQGGTVVTPSSISNTRGTFTFSTPPDPAKGSLTVSYTRPARGFWDFASAMKAANNAIPGTHPIKVCAGFNTFDPSRRSALIDAFKASNHPGPDCIVHHAYPTLPDGYNGPTWTAFHNWIMTSNDAVVDATKTFKSQIDAAFPNAGTELVATEYGLLNNTNSAEDGSSYNKGLGGTISAARLWSRIVNGAEVSVALRHTLLTPVSDAASVLLDNGTYAPRATGLMFSLLKQFKGTQLLTAAVPVSPTRSANSSTYNTLTAIATRGASKVRVLLVNADPGNAINVDLNLTGTSASSYLANSATVATLDAYDSSGAIQDPSALILGGNGADVEVRTRTQNASNAFNLPAHSMALVTFTQ